MAKNFAELGRLGAEQKFGVKLSFGPYWLLNIVPWLMIAAALRVFSRYMPGSSILIGMLLLQVTIFIAYIIASQRMIELAGGFTSLSKLSLREQAHFGWAVVWRLLIFCLSAVVTAICLGMHPNKAAQFWFGFDGLAFPWRQGVLQVWIAAICLLAFLFVVEKGLQRPTRFVSVLRELFLRIRFLLPAFAGLALFLMVSTFIQIRISGAVMMLQAVFANRFMTNLIDFGYVFIFSYGRLWVTVAILTYALRASYRSIPTSA
ncbi:hypothetical protein [Pararhizobium sp.]|uniref:hypothetical protein n=1 Tax=Pararhizobium sp. TaxID=1977563 RepID=UPI002721B1A6|nr:hypothetical protein [Pararhizobium sp.]MDO9414875.1 hypothetical protein [Pararhizobium sp.]